MTRQILIDNIVRQTTVLIAQLATFSSLEKLTEIADSVKPLGDLLTTTANSTASSTTATAPPAATDTVTGGNS